MSGQFTTSPRAAPGSETGPQAGSEKLVTWAWVSLAFYPVSFLAAFVVGELLLSLYGYAEDESAPFWIGLAAVGPALVTFSVPGICAVVFARRAMRLGNRAGMAPAVIGVAVALGLVAVNVVGAIVGALT